MKAWKVTSLTLAVVALVSVMCAAVLIHRGFRATNQPSRIETIVAHTARNLSIPSAARSEKNPLEATQQTLQDGRDAFMAECQTCHGNDGSGLTQLAGVVMQSWSATQFSGYSS